MAQVYSAVIVTPAPGKEARLRELFTQLANHVEKNEKEILKFQVFEQHDGENGNVFVFHELYQDEAAHEAHFKTPYFTEFSKTFTDEGLLGAPVDIKKMKLFAGFESR
ncbi:hypothetical protein DSL72_000726 [Monilinia vaccinii-corymbosi]|uniref:ABM domain-containing protein n=1 Tax=Monilinia vaccinii-corymbosi TaxID=61207 RepID=A0A8A3P054_9HELO|nr:hypothetical protein DSL72_000726 [Monilinia vaccinii-corymbosi]